MEIIDKIIALIYSILILVNAVCLRKLIGTWLFPGCIFSLFWFFYTFFPLAVLFEVPVNPNAIGFIAIAVVLFSSSFLLFNWKRAFEDNLYKPNPALLFNTKFLKLTLLSAVLISLFSSVMHVLAQGFNLIELIKNPIGVAGEFANARYQETLNYTAFGPISLLFSNISVIIGGLIFGSVSTKNNKKLLFAFLPSIIILITQSSKGLFFLSVFLFLGGMMVTRLFLNKLTVFSFKVFKNILLVVVSFIVLLALSFLSRGLQEVNDTAVLLDNFRILFSSYFFTHVYGFSDWFTAYTGGDAKFSYDLSNYHMGFYTLTAFFKMLGTDKVTSAGVYDEFFTYKNLLESNIYTMFRGMIMDFGLLGALVFMLLNGYFINLIYYIFLRRVNPVMTVVLLIFTLGYFYISFIISLLTWVIIPFTFIICYLILKFNSYHFVIKPTTQE